MAAILALHAAQQCSTITQGGIKLPPPPLAAATANLQQARSPSCDVSCVTSSAFPPAPQSGSSEGVPPSQLQL